MSIYHLARPLLFKIEPETAHRAMIRAMRAGVIKPCGGSVSSPMLEQDLFGLRFPNPVGLAAGFDKDAEVVGPALALGFGFVEAGTVTPKPQKGNPRPRVFRAPDHGAVINRMGFPNGGLARFKSNLEAHYNRSVEGIVGINIGMNKEQKDPASDYCALIEALGPMADYLTINISSPNTPGLRDLQKKEALSALLGRVMAARKDACPDNPPALLVKLAPDLDEAQQEEIAHTLVECKVDGVILTNTTLERPEDLPEDFRSQAGGLSGVPLRDKSTEVIRNFYRLSKGALPIIGVGGVSSGAHAYEKIRAGACLVQLYTGMIYEGPNIAASINKELLGLMERDGIGNISEAVGVDANSSDKKRA